MKIISVALEDNRPDTGIVFKDKSLTQQNLSAESDINNIIKRFEKTGMITYVSNKVATYGDFSDVPDYHEAMNIVNSANELFGALSADVRERFDNDPSRLLVFLSDSKNREEAAKLGLVQVQAPKVDNPSAVNNTPPKS